MHSYGSGLESAYLPKIGQMKKKIKNGSLYMRKLLILQGEYNNKIFACFAMRSLK